MDCPFLRDAGNATATCLKNAGERLANVHDQRLEMGLSRE